ncbi:DNA/RNA nuclease SfsA [Desulforhopalus singaporensis]|uniref:Sugar fermentation stimulation protein homolog n=1 Tax=Desulforhopalus singaporensis TaxID=91360 RepID=A0A1H0SDM4_9BACT|nr:DNA/RNA nuclease SfsA [Desulforhopalus singaporensis]SDP39834.1 sugar fermentation stimulation protein A [Desulforhopalus singaporensis]
MKFDTPLLRGTLVKRYKRFLADVTLDSGETITVHCPNTGTMLSCSAPGSMVGLSVSYNPKRKYPHTLEMVRVGNNWVGVNTARTNKLVAEAVEQGRIDEFQDVHRIKSEVKTSSHTRLDLQIFHGESTTYVEIKNCSLAQNHCAMFPDAVTARGTKHLQELARLCREGSRACIFFLVQRADADRFAPASHIDPVYSMELSAASAAGVMVLAYQARVSPEAINIYRQLPVELDQAAR